MESLEQTTLSFEGLSINLSGDSSLLKTHSLKIGPEMTSTLAFLKFCVYGLRNNSWSLQNNYVQNLSVPPACSDHSLNVKIEKACVSRTLPGNSILSLWVQTTERKGEGWWCSYITLLLQMRSYNLLHLQSSNFQVLCDCKIYWCIQKQTHLKKAFHCLQGEQEWVATSAFLTCIKAEMAKWLLLTRDNMLAGSSYENGLPWCS